jgi:ribosomal protein L11 methyltransferase
VQSLPHAVTHSAARVAASQPLCHTTGVARTWTEVTTDVPRQHGDAVANFLMDYGATGLQWAEDGDTARLTAYFANEPPLDALLRYYADLGCAADGSGELGIATRLIADEDWAQSWRLHSQPQLVCPSWADAAPTGRTAIIIDPGMAFGTGQHASTRGCLQRLERATVGRPPPRALDVGTGSGVLAIALAKLGVGDVWAVDTDPTACAVATANSAANGVATQVHVVSDLDDVPGTFGLVVANLYADLLEGLAPQLAARLSADATLIVSGLLLVDEARVRATYQALGLMIAECQVEDSWVTLALRTRAQS